MEQPAQSALSISAVERDTGLTKDTLRVWERRYDFPKPLRDHNGERAYPTDQVEKLKLIKRLMDRGHRPGKVIGLPAATFGEFGKRVAGSRRATLRFRRHSA